ncbi:hypothetical protein AAG570_000646 [Ranatra chinensis]|uniref:AAA+ ATPase domain-containing protein n=1 Tax=Ranatra chinensis TaxID=642074 RepID=A0ABD0YXM3_9HEMI
MKLVEGRDLKPGDNVCVDKDSFIVVDTLPNEIDPRVAAMEVVDRPTDSFLDVGGLDRQIQELLEAVVLPLTHPEKFAALGIPPPKGVLLYGAPGTGKTLVARACANKTQSTFLKLAGSNLVQCYIGGGAKLVRDTFQLAKMKAPTIVFIDELDAVGSRRRDASERSSGEREVDRTLIELLNQMDGFSTRDQVKVIGATNRVDVLDPALLRSGRMDKKIEFPEPDEAARTRVMQIHTRKMKVGPDVDLEEIGRTTEGFNCAMCKALCTEAAMLALRRGSQSVAQADFVDAVSEVLARKKFNANHYV